jgi:hypothetical protein
MELTVLAVPDCPNAPLLEERLADVVTAVPDVTVRRLVVSDEAEAIRLGMRGSPTLLIDDGDAFPAPGPVPGLACRLYRAPDGRLEGAPSAAELRQALQRAGLSI